MFHKGSSLFVVLRPDPIFGLSNSNPALPAINEMAGKMDDNHTIASQKRATSLNLPAPTQKSEHYSENWWVCSFDETYTYRGYQLCPTKNPCPNNVGCCINYSFRTIVLSRI